MRQTEPSALLIALPIIFVIIIFTAVFVAALLLTDMLGMARQTIMEPGPTPLQHPTPAPIINGGTPAPLGMTPYKSTALGFELAYPQGWHKQENALSVIFSPSFAGLDAENLQDSAVWLGIPANNAVDHSEILQEVLSNFLPNVTVLTQEIVYVTEEPWTRVRFSFEGQNLGETGRGIAAATSKNEVGYFFVAVAPTSQWDTMEPIFQQMIDKFGFTEDVVLRPTDATPPPTPTPTPTPIIYVVQSGDTLMGIALEFGVDMDTLAARNGIEVPESLRTGQKLIIPLR